MKRRLFCLCLALLLTAQLVLPAAAETAAAETTEPAVTETTAPEETTVPTEETTAPTEETTAPTEETTAPTEETTAPTEETTAPTEQTEEDEEDEETDSAAPLADAEGTEIVDAAQVCGENLTWTLDDGTLTISGTGAMTDYDRNNKAPWQGQTIQNLVLNEGITSIGAHAFEFVNLQNQGTLQLPSSLQSIGEYAFYGCGLSGLTIGPNLTTIGAEALTSNFWNQITISEGNTALVFQNGVLYAQNMTRIVAVLSTLDSVFTLPETVITIDNSAFINVGGLQNLKLNSSFRGFSSGAIGFDSCFSLRSITVPEDNAALCSKDGVLFTADGKTLLTYPMAKQDSKYEIPTGTEKIANYAIDNNIYLFALVIPEGVTDLGYYNFRYCQALKKVTLPSTVQIIRDESIGFFYNNKVDGFIIRGVPGSAAETYATANGFTFQDSAESEVPLSGSCGDNLTWTLEDGTLTISGTGAMTDYDSDNKAPWQGQNVREVVLEEGITHVGTQAFKNIELMNQQLQLPGSLQSLGEEAFLDCSLSALTIDSNLTTIDANALGGNLWDQITVSEENTAFVMQNDVLYTRDMTRLVAVENTLEGVFTLPDTVSTIDDYAFVSLWNVQELRLNSSFHGFSAGVAGFNNYTLQSITVSAGNTALCDKDGVLFTADGKTLLAYPTSRPGTRYEIPAGTERIADDAINSNRFLEELVIPEGVTDLGYNFRYCQQLKKVTLPASVKVIQDKSIGYVMDSDGTHPIDGFTICGVPGSAAETYATANGLTFEAISQESEKNYCGDSLTWTLENGTLTISGTGAMTDYDSENKAPWRGQNVQKVVLEEGITHVGTQAFKYLDLSNQQLQLPSSLQSLGQEAFFGCLLPALTIGSNLTTIGADALGGNFWDQITVSEENPAFVVQNGVLYTRDMTRLVAVENTLDRVFTLPDDVSTIDDYALMNLGGVQELHLNSSFHGFSAGVAGFNDCHSLQSITVPTENTSLCAKDGVLFTADGKTLLAYPASRPGTTYEIPAGTERIAEFALNSNEYLEEVVIPEGVIALSYNFTSCQRLKKVTIPSTVALEDLQNGFVGYYNGKKVEGFIIRGVSGSAAETYATANGFTFQDSAEPDVPGESCGDNLTWTLEDGILTISGTGDMWNYGWNNPAPWDGLQIDSLVLEEGITSIGDYAFWQIWVNCELRLPDSLRSLGERAFSGNGFTSLTIGPNLISIGQNALTNNHWAEITVSADNPAFVYQNGCLYSRDMTRLVAVLEKLGDVFELPEGVVTVDNEVFWNTDIRELKLNCSFGGFSTGGVRYIPYLESIIVPEGNTALCAKDGVLFSADGKTLLAYPEGRQSRVYEIPEGTRKIEFQAIYSNQYLEELVIPSGVSVWEKGADYCDNLKRVTVPATVQRIEDYALGYIGGEAVEGFTICGAPGSEAERYANDNGFAFEATLPALAENACGDNLTWALQDGTLTISGTGEMWDFVKTDEVIGSIGHMRSVTTAPWGREEIQRLIIEDGVTSVGQYAFTSQLALGEIRFPGTLKYIDAHAFESCGLFTVRLPEGLEKIGDRSFSISWMQEVYIPASLSEIGESAFRSGKAVKFVVADGNQFFCMKDGGLYSKDMTRLCAQNWTGSTAVIPDSVETVDVEVLNNIMVDTLIIGANCDLRSKINEYNLGYAELREIQVSEQNPYHASKDGVLFSKDGTELSAYPKKKSGTIYQVPEGVTGIRNYAIWDTIELKNVVLPETLQELSYYAITSERIKEIYVPASVTEMSWRCIGFEQDVAVSGFRVMGAPGSAAQAYAEENGFEFVPVTQTSFTVHYDANGGQNAPDDQLRTLGTVLTLSGQIPTKPGYSFLGWDTSASAALPKYKAGDPYAENEDITLYAVWVQGDITNSGICGDDLVWYLDKDGTLTISGTGEMYDIPTMNSDGSSPEPWATLDFRKVVFSEGVTYICQAAFSNCTQLRELAPLPSTLKRIGYSPFFGCTNLTGQLVLPEGLEVIQNFAFYNTGISGVLVLPDSLREIGALAFASCENLFTVYVGGNVQSIGTYGFGAPDDNARILYAGSREQWLAIAEDGTELPKGGIHYNAAKPLSKDSGMCGSGMRWFYENGTLTIVGDGSMDNYTEANPAPWDSYGMEIRTVEVQEGVAVIGERAFWDCARMTTLSLPDHLESIGKDATLGCDSLASVFYGSSKAKFNAIRISEGNEALRKAKLYCGSTTYQITYNNLELGDTNPNPDFGVGEQDVTLAAAQRTGYTFGGWYADEALTRKVTKISKGNEDDVVLWAKWTANSFTIEFKGNATGVTGTVAKVKGATGVPLTMPESTFQRKGYSFMYWTADSAGQGLPYNAGEEFTFTAEKNGQVFTAYAQWSPNRYTLELDPNGGDGDMDSVDACYDESLTLPESEFQRTGYVFTGWNTKADGKGTAYKAGASVKNLAAEGSVTLYAQWKANTYTVQFVGGGDKVTGSMKKQTLTYGKAAALTANAFKRTGYVFDGWQDEEGNTYANKQSVTSLIPEGTVVLTAQWTPITYTVKFKANGGQGEMDDVVLTYDEETEQPTLGFAREGYRFLGWATSANGTVAYTPDEPLENLTSKAGATVTLYAKWTPYSYTVVYDGNGATDGSTKNQTMLCGKTYTLTKNGYTRKGYSFRGWSTIADTRVPEYTNSQKGVALSDTDMDVVTLYAVWLPVEYSVIYKNVTYIEGTILAQTYNIETKGEAIVPGARPGCEFAGWYLDAKLTKEFTGFVPGTRTGNLTLYAKWNGDATRYVIRFAPGAEDVTGNMPDMTKLVSGKDYTLTKNAYKRTGYTFVGWDLDGAMMEDREVFSDMPAYVPGYVENDPIVLTARWKPTVCKLTYKNVTAQEQEGLPTAYDIEHPAALPELSREGYDFGWYTDSGLKKPLTDNTVTGTGAKTIYAKWTAHKYLITFVANNGTSGTMQDISMTYGVSKALAANKYKRTGYTFLGWSTDPEDTVPMYKNQAKVLNLTADSDGVVTLFAIWKPTEYTLTYKNVTRDEASGLPTSYNIETEGTVPNASGRPVSNFVGWYLDSKLTKPFTGFVPGTLPKNLTLYAAWNGPTIHYSIHFASGAEGVTGKMADKTNLVCGKDYPLTKNAFKRAGYTFTGWTLYNASWKDGAVVSNLPIYVPGFYDGETFTLTAQWTPTSCKLTYKNVTAQELEELPAAYDIENPAVLPQLTREGYDFGGWFTDSSFKKPVADNTVSGTGNRTLYAKWTAHKYTVAFDGNGGTSKTAMKPMTATYGTAKALTANSFSRSGYTFLGWSEDPNATQATYKNQAKVLNLTPENGETVTLYAVWKAK